MAIDNVNPNRLVAYGTVGGVAFGLAVDRRQHLHPEPRPQCPGDAGQCRVLPHRHLPRRLPGAWQFGSIAHPGFPTITDQGANAYVPGVIYMSDHLGVYVTMDGGQHWLLQQRQRPAHHPDPELPQCCRRSAERRRRLRRPQQHQQRHLRPRLQDHGRRGHLEQHQQRPARHRRLESHCRSANRDAYIGINIGVFYLAAGSGSWQSINDVGLPDVEVRDLVLNTTLNTLSAGTYGRGLYTHSWTRRSPGRRPSACARSAARPHLTGNINLTADTTIRTEANSSLTLEGSVKGTNDEVTKIGSGTLVLTGSNSYGGAGSPTNNPGYIGTPVDTHVVAGILAVGNVNALGSTASDAVVDNGTVLQTQSDLGNKTIIVNGNGLQPDGHHFTGSLYSISNATPSAAR